MNANWYEALNEEERKGGSGREHVEGREQPKEADYSIAIDGSSLHRVNLLWII
jgi:hypothetical protein